MEVLEGADLEHLPAACACGVAESVGNVAGAAGDAVPDENRGDGLFCGFGESQRFFDDGAIGDDVGIVISERQVEVDEIAARFYFRDDLIEERPPASGAVDDGGFTKAFGSKGKNHKPANAELAGGLKSDEICSAGCRRDHCRGFLSFEQLTDARMNRLDGAAGKDLSCSVGCIDAASHQGYDHLLFRCYAAAFR